MSSSLSELTLRHPDAATGGTRVYGKPTLETTDADSLKPSIEQCYVVDVKWKSDSEVKKHEGTTAHTQARQRNRAREKSSKRLVTEKRQKR